MKIRSGFVSNSSSSSFICDVCGHDYSGWDACLSDANMMSCTHGHTFCIGHLKGEDGKTPWLEICKEHNEKYKQWLLSRGKSLDGFEELDQLLLDDPDAFIDEVRGESDLEYEFPEKYCPCCNLTNVAEGDIIAYAFFLLGKGKKELAQEIREKFKTVKELNALIKSE